MWNSRRCSSGNDGGSALLLEQSGTPAHGAAGGQHIITQENALAIERNVVYLEAIDIVRTLGSSQLVLGTADLILIKHILPAGKR